MNFFVSLKRALRWRDTTNSVLPDLLNSRVKINQQNVGPLVAHNFAMNGTKSATKRTHQNLEACLIYGALHLVTMTHLGKLHDLRTLGKR
jgi:hypothetical protein